MDLTTDYSAVHENSYIIDTPKRNVLGEVTNSQYVSPTANLKLLTNVALHYPTPPSSARLRKEKSLQFLCDRFLEVYPLRGHHSCTEIHLDSTAARLGVEKRRIYDIINILEAIQCATHRRKNTYAWHGASKMNSFLRTLKRQGEALGLASALRGSGLKPASPKHKTLGILAQRFLMLFLVMPNNTLINLEMAVAVLIGNNSTEESSPNPDQAARQHKSKVRRLYDIANIFTSLGLIEKVSSNCTVLKKPVFRYRGPQNLKETDPTEYPMLSPLTPISSFRSTAHYHVTYSTSRSKRKLEFTESQTSKSLPTDKWDEILYVADMELSRLNNTI